MAQIFKVASRHLSIRRQGSNHLPDLHKARRLTGLKSLLSNISLFSTHRSGNMDSFSYIIVGAGSAGCVLANRLSESHDETVLVLEAGPKDLHFGSKRLSWKIHMPAGLMYNLCDDKYNWYYHTVPQRHMDDRIMYWPRGRVWGGSSSLNAMVYVRGHAEDYNRWQSQGATGWDYSHCLPYFKKAQTHELGPDLYRGGSGPLHVSRGKTNHVLHQAFIKAAQDAGYPFTEDMNGYQQEGVGWMDMTINKGKRLHQDIANVWSSSSVEIHDLLLVEVRDGARQVPIYVQQWLARMWLSVRRLWSLKYFSKD